MAAAKKEMAISAITANSGMKISVAKKKSENGVGEKAIGNGSIMAR